MDDSLTCCKLKVGRSLADHSCLGIYGPDRIWPWCAATMRQTAKIFVLSILLVLSAAPLLAGLEEGAEAFERGDYRTALQAWEPLAKGGDPAAQYNLAILYEYGLGVFKDLDQAVGWYVKSAEQGFPEAQVSVGDLYLDGYWGDPDDSEAADWYGFAAEQGHQEAIDKLSNLKGEQVAALPRLDPPTSTGALFGGACEPVREIVFKVEVETHIPDPPVNHDLSIDELSKELVHGGKERILGLTKPDLEIATQHRYRTTTRGKTLCFWIEEIQVRMIYKALEVFVAKDYRRSSCEYRAVLAHEQEHLAVARDNLERYAPEVRRALTSLLIPTPQRPVQIDHQEDANETYQRLYAKILDPIYKRMKLDLEARHAALDTPQSYAAVRRRCRNW